jgi:hypothetical protein
MRPNHGTDDPVNENAFSVPTLSPTTADVRSPNNPGKGTVMNQDTSTRLPASTHRRKLNTFEIAANRRWGTRNIEWIRGYGSWALVSHCPPRLSITLWKTRQQAEAANKNLFQCGGRCWEPAHHRIYLLHAPRRRASRGRAQSKAVRP